MCPGVVQVSAPAGTLKGEEVKANKTNTNPATIKKHTERSLELGAPAVALQGIHKKFWLKGKCPYIAHIPFPVPAS